MSIIIKKINFKKYTKSYEINKLNKLKKMSQNGSEQIISSEQKKSNGEEIEESENLANQKIETENQNKEDMKGSEQIPTENNNPPNEYNYEQNKKEIMEKIEIRKQQADLVDKYIHETGIGTSFQMIFSELISKKIPVENY